jgi:hypothetical protein
MSPWLVLTIAMSTLGQAEKPGETDDAATRLAIMKDSLSVHALRETDNSGRGFRLKAEPVMRFNNPVGHVTDGAIFLWLDEDERPAAAVQVFKSTKGQWEHAFSSLSTTSVELGSLWGPTRSGVVFKPVPGAPRPAATAEQRLVQMRALSKGFGAQMELDFKTNHALRMLSKPLARYGKPGSGVLDGALFSFVLTTDPEVYLLLEARDGKDGPEWQYAFAPEASAPLQCSWKGATVWEFAADSRIFEPREPYFVRGFTPERR